MAAAFVPFHVASDAEGLAAAAVWALERLLASVRAKVRQQREAARLVLAAARAADPLA